MGRLSYCTRLMAMALFLYIHAYSYISPNLLFVQTPSFFFKFMLILISVQIFCSPKTPSFFSLNSFLFLYQSKSSVSSNPLFFFFNFMLIFISVQIFCSSKTPSFFLYIHAYSYISPNLPFVQTVPPKCHFFSLNSCLFLYQSKSSVHSNPLFFFSLNSCLFSYQSKPSVCPEPHL